MSGIWAWFGGGAAQKRKDSAAKNAIVTLRSTLEILRKRESHLLGLITEAENVARKNINTNKNVAREALKRKKRNEQALEQTHGQIAVLEQQINAIENANFNRETVLAAKLGNKTLKHMTSEFTREDIAKLQDEMEEQDALGEELQTMLKEIINLGGKVDDADLELELEGLQQEMVNKQMLDAGKVPESDVLQDLSIAADKLNLETAVEDEDEEIEKLRKEMLPA